MGQLAIHSSTPVVSTAGISATTVTSASFTPPPKSVLLVIFAVNGAATGTAQSIASVTDNMAVPLIYTMITGSRSNVQAATHLGGTTEFWYAPVTTSGVAMTVTGTFTTSDNSTASPGGLMQVVVLTGANTVQNGAANTASAINNTTLPSASLTTTTTNSWVFAAVINWFNATGPTVPVGQTISINGQNSRLLNATNGDAYWAQLQTNLTNKVGTSVTVNDTAPVCSFNMSIVEVLPSVAPSFIQNNLRPHPFSPGLAR